jgi:hypothetical protein
MGRNDSRAALEWWLRLTEHDPLDVTSLGLVDEYRIDLHPVVLGHGRPYITGPRPPLRLVSGDRIGESVLRLAYVPA